MLMYITEYFFKNTLGYQVIRLKPRLRPVTFHTVYSSEALLFYTLHDSEALTFYTVYSSEALMFYTLYDSKMLTFYTVYSSEALLKL